jgi:hypothetical protein
MNWSDAKTWMLANPGQPIIRSASDIGEWRELRIRWAYVDGAYKTRSYPESELCDWNDPSDFSSEAMPVYCAGYDYEPLNAVSIAPSSAPTIDQLRDQLEAARYERDELRDELEWQAACTKALLESQDRLAAELQEMRQSAESYEGLYVKVLNESQDRLAAELVSERQARAEAVRDLAWKLDDQTRVLREIAHVVCGDAFYVDVPGSIERELRPDIAPSDVLAEFESHLAMHADSIIERDEKVYAIEAQLDTARAADRSEEQLRERVQWKLREVMAQHAALREAAERTLKAVDADLAEADETGHSHQSNSTIRGYVVPLRAALDTLEDAEDLALAHEAREEQGDKPCRSLDEVEAELRERVDARDEATALRLAAESVRSDLDACRENFGSATSPGALQEWSLTLQRGLKGLSPKGTMVVDCCSCGCDRISCPKCHADMLCEECHPMPRLRDAFDSEAVREFLDAWHAWGEATNSARHTGDTTPITEAWGRTKLAVQRVRESERKS